jgi:hypothetical protein
VLLYSRPIPLFFCSLHLAPPLRYHASLDILWGKQWGEVLRPQLSYQARVVVILLVDSLVSSCNSESQVVFFCVGEAAGSCPYRVLSRWHNIWWESLIILARFFLLLPKKAGGFVATPLKSWVRKSLTWDESILVILLLAFFFLA